MGGLGLIGTAAVFTATSACDDDKTQKGKRWPQEGEWRQYGARSESLGPFLKGLGVPGFAVVMVDLLSTDLSIQVAGSTLKVTDTTAFGANKTEVELGAPEVEKSTKTGRKKFMMSGFEDGAGLAVQCRLFQRGEGWYTKQTWEVDEEGFLKESMQLQRPLEDDVTVVRTYRRLRSSNTVTEQSKMLECEVSDDNTKAWLALAGVGLALCWFVLPSSGSQDSKDH